MKLMPIDPRIAALVAALLLPLGPSLAASTSPARTVGFTVGAVAVIKPTCGYDDDPDGIGRLLLGARLAKSDILPGGRLRAEFEAGGIEARQAMGAKLQREGRGRFCAFALARFGPGGLGVIRS